MIGVALVPRVIFAALLAAALPSAAPTQPTVVKADGRVIVRLVCRQQIISVLATSNGVRYSAADQTRREIFSAASLESVKIDHPEIYKLIAPTLCSADSNPAADSSAVTASAGSALTAIGRVDVDSVRD